MFRKFNLTTDFTDSTDSKLLAIMYFGCSFHGGELYPKLQLFIWRKWRAPQVSFGSPKAFGEYPYRFRPNIHFFLPKTQNFLILRDVF